MRNDFLARDQRLIQYWTKIGFVGPSSAILDIGAGSGHVIRCLREGLPSINIECVEGDRDAAGYLRSLGIIVFSGLEEPGVNRYDSIILIEVLEHINDPIDFLLKCKTLLAPSGQIFFSTPCGETRFGNRALKAYDTPEHVQFWTENSFRICCEKAGLVYHPIAPGIMYPAKTRLECFAKHIGRSLRDLLVGRSHLVGFLRPS